MRRNKNAALPVVLLLFMAILITVEKNWVFQLQFPEAERERRLLDCYETVWEDIRCFPVPLSSLDPALNVVFENSWMFERNYGGSYGHEGCDLMPEKTAENGYPVLSMTDGVVENVGWLEKGGHRIGIRSPGGVYFYYAHLEAYGQDFQPGDPVEAGELLGFMGDSGYGPEGTTGKFPVHLHVGIYLRTQESEELAVNPYWFLKYLENQKISYAYE